MSKIRPLFSSINSWQQVDVFILEQFGLFMELNGLQTHLLKFYSLVLSKSAQNFGDGLNFVTREHCLSLSTPSVFDRP